MSAQDNAAAFRKLLEVGFSRGEVAVIAEVVSPEFVEHQRGLKPGIAGMHEAIDTLHRWFSDFGLTVEELAAEGDLVWARNRARGVNTGAVMGHPPTGKPMEVDVIDIARFENGKLIEHWGVADQLGMLLQLGLVPRPQPPGR